MTRDYINILELLLNWNHHKWNSFLTEALQNKDVRSLENTKERLQAGMAKLAKEKMNTDQIVTIYLRWISSIDKTLRKIHKKNNPNPLNEPSTRKLITDPKQIEKFRAEKKKKDAEFSKYLKNAGY